uniref:hypothetical protein n=1 Tax=Fulvivirga sp. TaxID=1931237 RepID=UPI004049C99D
MKITVNLALLFMLLMVSCKSGNQKSPEELAEQEQFKLDSIAAMEIDVDDFDEDFGEGPDDDEIQEYGLFIEVEDGGYPFYSVTVEFPEREMSASFTANQEKLGLAPGYLESLKDKYVTFYYTSALDNDLYEMVLDGKSVLGEDAIEISEDLKSVTGILSGADEVTGGDLPTEITINCENGERVNFELFVNPEMVPANGKSVTVYYGMRSRNEITFIKISE